MNSEISSPSVSKKRRIMIITADDNLIEQIQKNSNASLFNSIFLDSNGDNVEFSPSNIKNIQTQAQLSNNKKPKTGSLTCVVCGATANGYNFDVISCESCKAFFRRNAFKDPAKLECRRNGDCDITYESRRRCGACRLIKCLKSGMKRDRLLTAEQKAIKLLKMEENRNLTIKTEHNDNEKSTTVLSHLSSSKNTTFRLIKDFTDLLTEKSSQEQRALLSSEDLKRVETIQLSYEQRIELAARDGLPWNPSIHESTLLQRINGRSVSALRLVSFFKQIPEFKALNAEDRFTLVKYNLIGLVVLNSSLSYNMEADAIMETDSDAPWNPAISMKVHGDEIHRRVKKVFDSFVRIARYDQRIIQLALIVLILTKGFSTNGSASEPILDDSLGVYRAQKYYTELLWKYLQTVHGNNKAIQIFKELVVHFISWQTLQEYLCRDLPNVLTATEMNELLPIMKSLLQLP